MGPFLENAPLRNSGGPEHGRPGGVTGHGNPSNPWLRRPTRRGLLAPCCVLLCIALTPVPAAASFEFQAVGARSGGLGDTFVGWAEGVEGVFWNAGAVAWGHGVSITGGYERPFGMAVLDAHAIGTVASTGRTAVGLGYQEYGFSLYRERTAGLTFGLRLASRLGLGVRIRRMRLSVAGGANRGWTAFDLGAKIVVRPKVTLGLAAWNAGGASVEVLGQGGMAGVGCQVAPNLALLVDVRKEAGRQTGVSAGVEYSPARRVMLRMGAGGRAERLSIGAGVIHRGIRIDYATLYHTVLGLSHRVSLTVGR